MFKQGIDQKLIRMRPRTASERAVKCLRRLAELVKSVVPTWRAMVYTGTSVWRIRAEVVLTSPKAVTMIC